MYHGVKVEPQLQQLTGERLSKNTANARDHTQVDISARWFWQADQQALYNIRVFYSKSQTLPQSWYPKMLWTQRKRKPILKLILNTKEWDEKVKSFMESCHQKYQKNIMDSKKISFSLMNSRSLCLRGRMLNWKNFLSQCLILSN